MRFIVLGLLHVAVAACLLAEAAAQDFPSFPTSSRGADPAPDARDPSQNQPAPADNAAGFFRAVGRVEFWQLKEKIVDSSNNFNLTRSDLEHEMEAESTHGGGFLEVEYHFPQWGASSLQLRAGIGFEQLTSHLAIGPDNAVLGNPSGTTELDLSYDVSFTWDIGAEYRYRMGPGPFDLGAAVSYRAGDQEGHDAITTDSYQYRLFRGGIFGGWTVAEGVRPYVGVYYNHYDARFKLSQAPGQDFTLKLQYKTPVNIPLGIELTGGPVQGRMELDFLGTFGVMASVGFRF